MKKALIIISLFTIMLSSCKKDDEGISTVPEISLVSVSPMTVEEFQDSIVFSIYYRDGDGDLGENDPDVENLFVTDNRIGTVSGFRVMQLAPDNSTIAIQGTLEVTLNSVGITDNSQEQNVDFDIYMVDRAGNRSNTVTSSSVKITR